MGLVLGYSNDSDAMKRHCKGVVKRYPLQTAGGMQEVRVLSEPDVLRLIVSSTLPAAEAFERLVFEEILPTIRKTGSYTTPQKPTDNAEKAMKLIPLAARAARALGLDKNAAAISANQAVAKLTGTNVMQLLGATHLESEQQTLFFTPTDLGKRIGVSGRGMNMLLAEAGLQAKRGEYWAHPLGHGRSLAHLRTWDMDLFADLFHGHRRGLLSSARQNVFNRPARAMRAHNPAYPFRNHITQVITAAITTARPGLATASPSNPTPRLTPYKMATSHFNDSPPVLRQVPRAFPWAWPSPSDPPTTDA